MTGHVTAAEARAWPWRDHGEQRLARTVVHQAELLAEAREALCRVEDDVDPLKHSELIDRIGAALARLDTEKGRP